MFQDFSKRTHSVLSVVRGGYYHGTAALVDRLTFFLLFSLIGHLFGETELGKISTALNLSNILLLVSDFGLPVYLQRESSRSSDVREILSMGVLVKTVFSLIGFLFVPVYLSQSSEFLLLPFAVYYFSLFLFSLSNLFLSVVIGRQKNNLYFRIIFSSRMIMLVSFIFLFFYKGIELTFLIFLAGSFSQLLLTLSKNEEKIYFKLNINLLKKVLKGCYPIWLGLLFVFTYDKIDILILNIFRGPAETGEYFAAYTVMKSFTILSSFYLVNYFTVLSKDFKSHREQFLSGAKQSLGISIIISVTLIIIFHFFSDLIMTSLFGKAFVSSGMLLGILSFSILFMLMNYNLGTILNSMDLSKLPMIGGGVALLINIILNIMFVPEYGSKAAALITVATEVSMFMILFFSFVKNSSKYLPK